jgi:NADH-ubiquinone oxidoreductase chain 4
LLIPLLGIFIILIDTSYGLSFKSNRQIKYMGLITTIINLIVSLIIFILFDFSGKQFQFIQIQEYYQTSYFDIYLGIDGISIYFVLLTTIIIPICLLSN